MVSHEPLWWLRPREGGSVVPGDKGSIYIYIYIYLLGGVYCITVAPEYTAALDLRRVEVLNCTKVHSLQGEGNVYGGIKKRKLNGGK